MLVLRAVDAGQRVTLQALDGLGVAPGDGLVSSTKLGLNPLSRLQIPPPPCEEEPRTRGEQEKHLGHRLESETRPERTRFDRRDEIGGKSAGR